MCIYNTNINVLYWGERRQYQTMGYLGQAESLNLLKCQNSVMVHCRILKFQVLQLSISPTSQGGCDALQLAVGLVGT